MSAAAMSPELAALFANYAVAVEANTRAWDEHSRIDGLPELQDRPWPKVQVGRLYKGRDGEGNEIYNPIYAYRVDDIEKKVQSHLDAALAVHGNGRSAEDRIARIRKSYADKAAEWTAELQGMVDQRKAMEDAAGLTAALEAGNATSAKVREIEQQIIAHVPTTLADVAAIAAWTIKGMSDDAENPLDDDAPLTVLASFGKAVAK